MNGQNAQSNNKQKEVFFIILVPSEEKLNLKFKFSSEIAPQLFYKKSIERGNSSFLEHNVFKLNIIQSEKKEKNKTEKNKTEKKEKKSKLEITIK